MRTVKLKDITLTITDGKHGDCKNHDGSGYYFISCKDVYDETIHYENARQITEDDFRDADRRTNLAAYDILITNSGTIGRMALVKDIPETRKTTFQKSVAIVRADTSQVVPNYLYYLLKSKVHDFINSSNGSAQKNLLLSTMRDFDISFVDSFETQHRIASILSRYDSLIENYQKQIKLLEEAAQRLYKEWFVDLHFPGHENTKIVDGVPEGWEKKKISDICQTVGGGTPSTKVAEYYDDGNIKWVTPTDITRSNCLCLFDTDKKITEDGLAHSSAKILPPETILMTSRASVGYFGIYDCEVCTNQGFISCIPNERSYQMYMLYNLINRVEEIRQKAGGSTYLEISKSVFRDFDIVLPSCMVLETFQEQSHKMLDCMRQIAKQLRLLTEARDRLLPKLMSGAIEV